MEQLNHKDRNTKETMNIDKSLKLRTVNKLIDSITTTEGAGFIVHRPFPTSAFSDFDPFLLLDEMGPMNLKSGEAKGAPDHPHRGFETVTYMLSGNFEHKDSQGNFGLLNPGDVQWMTAGSGVVHSEMPGKEITEKGGKLHGLQLWINLPRKDKMTKPYYQDIESSKIPIVHLPNEKGQVKVISGKFKETNSVINTKIPILYLHITLEAGGNVQVPVNRDFNIFAYVLNGEGTFDEKEKQKAGNGQMVIFNKDGESISINASKDIKDKFQIVLIGGIPINEPIARYGPFVMNTQQEIYQAIEDYRNNRLGKISI